MLLEEFDAIIDKLAKLNEDGEFHEDAPVEHHEEAPEKHEAPAEDHEEHTDVRSKIRTAIEPSVEIAKSIIKAIGKSADNELNGSKKMKDQEQQVKNFEKEARGACQQVVSVVEGNNYVPDKMTSSPRAYNFIKNSDSRDMDAIKLAYAIITFYNSLA